MEADLPLAIVSSLVAALWLAAFWFFREDLRDLPRWVWKNVFRRKRSPEPDNVVELDDHRKAS